MDNESNKPRNPESPTSPGSEPLEEKPPAYEHSERDRDSRTEDPDAALHDELDGRRGAAELEEGVVRDESGAKRAKPSKAKNEAWEWAKALFIALGLVYVIRLFIFAPFIVDGESMEPNFQDKERIIVNKILYNIREPKRGEVVVFHATEDKDYIKRIIALPGEAIRVQGDNVYINGQLLDEPYLKEAVDKAHQAGKNYNDRNYQETVVPEGSIFVMGDNRSNSSDSRIIHAIPFDKVVGRADLIFWPIGELHWIH
ncbi:signal peptidase I [Paenibacillus koleovorans]|uniref:signal peptidase I n=1 Tax=Paenibacillus koleovorans TaxID=121608 RepID=UPI000FDA101B|nr:signal peptidase I [Paenibacillus koleovorans]